MQPSLISLKHMILETDFIFLYDIEVQIGIKQSFRMLFCYPLIQIRIPKAPGEKVKLFSKRGHYQTVSGDVAPRTPGTWVHQGGPQGSQRTAASQICRAVECPTSH